MKIAIEKYLLLIPHLLIGLSMSSIVYAQEGKADLDHKTLAIQYEKIAQEMLAKVGQQKNILKNKPSTSFFGRDGEKIKKRITARIHRYTKAAEEAMTQADFHYRMAREDFEIVPRQLKEEMNKVAQIDT